MKMKIVVFSALIWIATSLGLHAETVQWPEKNPYFSITLPDAWTCKAKTDRDLRCKSADGSGIGVAVTVTKWTTEEHMNAQLPTLGEKLASALQLKDVEDSKIKEATTSGNVKLWRVETAGLSEGIALRVWVVAFRTENNPFIMLNGVVPKGDEAHEKIVAQILDSIAPVESKADTKLSAREFDPYKGSVETLLPAEFSGPVVKFKRTAMRDKTASWKEHGAVEAVSFSYNAIAIVIVKIDGEVVNFATPTDAAFALTVIADQNGATVVPKGNGQRFTARNGQIVGWTNGSLMCVVTGGTDPAAGNFEKAAPF